MILGGRPLEGAYIVNIISDLITKKNTIWESFLDPFCQGRKHLMESCGCPDLTLPVSRTVRNKFLLFIGHPIYSILLEQHGQFSGMPMTEEQWSDISQQVSLHARCSCLGAWMPFKGQGAKIHINKGKFWSD